MISRIKLLAISFEDYYSRLQKAESRVMTLALPYFAAKAVFYETFKMCFLTTQLGLINSFVFTATVIMPANLPLRDQLKNFLTSQSSPPHLFTPIMDMYNIGCLILFGIKVLCIGIISPKKLSAIDFPKNLVQKSYTTKKENLEVAEQPYSPASEEQTSFRGFASVTGMDALKEEFEKACPQLFTANQISCANGVLLYGPPGCGKSFIAKKFAEEVEIRLKKKIPVFEMKIGDLAGVYINETSIKIANFFNDAADEAKKNGTISILIIDEIDGFVPKKTASSRFDSANGRLQERGVFLQKLEGAAKQNILCIATTNNPGHLDDAAKRSGRFDLQFEVPLPDAPTCQALLRGLLKDRPHDSSIDFQSFGYIFGLFLKLSSADIKFIVDEAAKMAFSRCLDSNRSSTDSPITQLDLENALLNFLKERPHLISQSNSLDQLIRIIQSRKTVVHDPST